KSSPKCARNSQAWLCTSITILSPQYASPRRPAAINNQVLPCHVTRSIAGQEDDRTFELLRPAHSTHRQLLLQALNLDRRSLCRGKCSRRKAVHAHLIACPVHGQMAG